MMKNEKKTQQKEYNCQIRKVLKLLDKKKKITTIQEY